jgi:hypothetical protein
MTAFIGRMMLGLLASGWGLAGAVLALAEPADYGDKSNWLCRPDHPNACAADQTTTVVAADGTLTREAFDPDPAASIDCFYVYPTVSLDATPNSDLVAGPEEMSVISGQFARFGKVCRTFAPLYRQVTLTALRARLGGQAMEVDRALGYNDVLAAWNHYLANDNQGRGVVLIGHSQGSGVLTALIRAEIDGKPVQKQLVSALILGSSGVVTPPEADVGGTFQHLPVCRSTSQTGCVVQFASFRDTVPPPDESRFGRPREGDGRSVCVNPANLSGGPGELHAYLRNSPGTSMWVDGDVEIDTPFVSVPGLLSAQCVYERGFSYLSVTVNADPDDPRTDDIAGDVITNGEVNAGWGLHLIDVHLAMGNLVDLVRNQAAAYQGSE